MHFRGQNGGGAAAITLQRDVSAAGMVLLSELRRPADERRRRALKRVDGELLRRNYRGALSLVRQLQGKPGGLRGFGAAKQVPKGLSSLDVLKIDNIDYSYLKPLVDSVLDSYERSKQFASLDEVSHEGQDCSSCNKIYESDSKKDHLMCVQHEAGHFLIAYLLGILPRKYKIPSIKALSQDQFAGGRVEFIGFEFLNDVGTRKIVEKNFDQSKRWDNRGISSKTLNSFSCVILGGLVAEHLAFGYSEGLHSDVEKLDRVLKWLGFPQETANSQVKWAALNTIFILHRHKNARLRLAEAMVSARPVGFCIETVENAINEKEI